MKYSYVALNQENQKLTGVLSAESEAEAREKLHALSLSVISLQAEEANESELDKTEGIITYAFHVIGSKQNHIHGTIDAPDRKTALKRLITEYKFQVISLCEAIVPEAEQEEEGKKGLKELFEELEDEFGISQDKLYESKFEVERHSSDALEEARKEIVKNVEEIVARAEEILDKFDQELSGEEVHNIRSKIDTLMRIRLSNNIKYIQDLADELLVAIDITLQQHLQTVSSKIQGHGNQVSAKDLSEEAGHVAYLRDITKRMGNLMDGYQTSKRRKFRLRKSKASKPMTNPVLIKSTMLGRIVKKMLTMLQRMVFSKSTVVRKQYLQQFIESVHEFFKVAKTPATEFIPPELKAQYARPDDSLETDSIAEYIDPAAGSSFARLLQELRLFIGWLLAFYVTYFYLSVFTLVKLGTETPFFSFINRSLQSAFPFLVTAFFFLMYIGLTIALRWAHGRVISSSLSLLVSMASIALVLANF